MTRLLVATVHMPGYLPLSEDRHVFHDPDAAWRFLAGERRGDEDADDSTCDYSDAVRVLDYIGSGYHRHGDLMADHPTWHDGTGCVHADTPGHEGSPHDIGLMYRVSLWQHDGYPHEHGRLHGCEPCEYTCHGVEGRECAPGDTSCVHCALVATDEITCDDSECVAVHYNQRQAMR